MLPRSTRIEVFYKKAFLKISPEACNFVKKETLEQVISCDFCGIFKNILFHRTPPVAPSGYRKSKNTAF